MSQFSVKVPEVQVSGKVVWKTESVTLEVMFEGVDSHPDALRETWRQSAARNLRQLAENFCEQQYMGIRRRLDELQRENEIIRAAAERTSADLLREIAELKIKLVVWERCANANRAAGDKLGA